MDRKEREPIELDRVAIAFDAALRKLSQSVGSAMSSAFRPLLRVILGAVFLWYLAEFSYTLLTRGDWIWAALITGALILVVALLLSLAYLTYKEYSAVAPGTVAPVKNAAVQSIEPYVYINVMPVAAVWIATIWKVTFSTYLLSLTQKMIKVLFT